MKTRLFAIILTLALLLSLAACAEKTPTKYPENDFANLLSTDFWSMTESDLDTFLTEKGYARRVQDGLIVHYLCTLFGKDAYITHRFGDDGKVELISATYLRYNEQNEQALQQVLSELPADQWHTYRIAQRDDDFITFMTDHTENARAAFASADAALHEIARLELHGQTRTELIAFFDATMHDTLSTLKPASIQPGFAQLPYYEYYYTFPNGTIGLLYSVITATCPEEGVIGQTLEAGITLQEPDAKSVLGIPLLDFNAIGDVWSSYAPK